VGITNVSGWRPGETSAVRLSGVILVEDLGVEEPRIGDVGFEDGGDRRGRAIVSSVGQPALCQLPQGTRPAQSINGLNIACSGIFHSKARSD